MHNTRFILCFKSNELAEMQPSSSRRDPYRCLFNIEEHTVSQQHSAFNYVPCSRISVWRVNHLHTSVQDGACSRKARIPGLLISRFRSLPTGVDIENLSTGRLVIRATDWTEVHRQTFHVARTASVDSGLQ